MKHSFILKIDEISIDEISVLINILLDNRIKFHVLKSDNKVIKNKYEEVIDKAFWKEECMKLEEQLKTKHNGFMASVNESCDLAEEIQKYKEVIDRLKSIVNDDNVSITRLDLGVGIVNEKNDLLDILKEVE